MINFKEEVEKRKEQLIQDIETLCAIPSVYNEKTIGENQPYGSECRQALDAMLAIGKRDGFVVHDENGYAGHIDIGDQEEKIEFYTAEIEKAKAEFNESMANMAKKTKEAFSTDFNTKPEAEAEAVEVVEAKDVEIKDSDE